MAGGRPILAHAAATGFIGVHRATTGRPYHPSSRTLMRRGGYRRGCPFLESWAPVGLWRWYQQREGIPRLSRQDFAQFFNEALRGNGFPQGCDKSEFAKEGGF